METERAAGASAQSRRVIVIAEDFTEAGEIAMLEGARLAQGSELHVVHVVELGAPRSDAALDAANELLEEIPLRLRRELAAHKIVGRVFVHVRVADHGGVAGAIQQLAVDVDADLIVVGSHGAGGIVQRILGSSVAETLARTAHCPVVVARPKDYSALRHSPQIEPPCPACVQTRRATEGQVWWCDAHAESPRARVHRYGLTNSVSDQFYDSNVVPTGVKMI